MWWIDEKAGARLRRRRSITDRHHRVLGISRYRTIALYEDVENRHHHYRHHHYHYHHHHHHHHHHHMLFRRQFLTRFILHILSSLKRISLLILPNASRDTLKSTNSNLPTSTKHHNSLSNTCAVSYQVAIRLKTDHYSYHSETSFEYRGNDQLLRRRKSRVCSPLLLLLAQFLWIIPYLFFANYLERSLLPFRLMCYVDPDLLSVQRSLRIDSQHCIRHFFMNREIPTQCALNRPLQTFLYPKRVLETFSKKSAENQYSSDGKTYRNVRRVLVVRSAPRHSSYRDYIRDTWKRDVEPEIPVVFVSGKDSYDLREESETFDDILQFEFEDSYQNLTMKMMSIYRFFLERTDVEQIVVINDDTIVNATGLRHVFNRRQAVDAEQYYDTYEYDENLKLPRSYFRINPTNTDSPLYLIGKVSRGYPRLFFPWLPWYVSSHTYPHKCYPPFVQGSSFVISRGAAARILEQICEFPSIHLDDVMMGIITNCLNIRNIHHEGFDRHLLDDFIVFHYQFSRYTAEQMRELYAKVKHRL